MVGELGVTHEGVLLPAELRDAPLVERDAYAARVRRINAAFVATTHAVEDAARAAGVELDA